MPLKTHRSFTGRLALVQEEDASPSSGEDDGSMLTFVRTAAYMLRAWTWLSIAILVACAITMPLVAYASDMQAGIAISDFKDVHHVPRWIPIALFWGKEILSAVLCVIMQQGSCGLIESTEFHTFLSSAQTRDVRRSLCKSTMSAWAVGLFILCLEGWRVYPLIVEYNSAEASRYQVAMGLAYAVGVSICMLAQLIFIANLNLLWEITFHVLDEFCNGLKLNYSRTELQLRETGMSRREISDLNWVSLTNEYQEIFEFVKNMWRPFVIAVTSLFILLVTNIVLAILFAYLLHDPREVTYQFINAGLCCLTLLAVWFRTSSLHSKCVSKRYERESVLYLASKFYGHSQLPDHQRDDHHRFVYCIQQRPCAVIILGMMCTKQRFFQLLGIVLKSMSMLIAFRRVILGMESDIVVAKNLLNQTVS